MSQQIQKELLSIKGDNELLLVDDVINFARRNKKSALHSQFDWNEKRAALEHWRTTARRLIALHITYADGERKFVSLTVDRSRPGGGYRDVDQVIPVPSLMEVMLDDALRELERIRHKYERVKALAPVWAATAAASATRQRQKQKGGRQRAAAGAA